MTPFLLSTLSIIYTTHMGNLLIAPSSPQFEVIICKKEFKEVSTPNITPKAQSNLPSQCTTHLHYSHKATISSHTQYFATCPAQAFKHCQIGMKVLKSMWCPSLIREDQFYHLLLLIEKHLPKAPGKKIPVSTSEGLYNCLTWWTTAAVTRQPRNRRIFSENAEWGT